MKYITVRDFRSKSAKVWDTLSTERELVVTSSGRPLAILSFVTEDTVESALRSIRRARAEEAVAHVQSRSLENGMSEVSLDDINKEIKAVRKRRRR